MEQQRDERSFGITVSKGLSRSCPQEHGRLAGLDVCR